MKTEFRWKVLLVQATLAVLIIAGFASFESKKRRDERAARLLPDQFYDRNGNLTMTTGGQDD